MGGYAGQKSGFEAQGMMGVKASAPKKGGYGSNQKAGGVPKWRG